MLCYVVDKHLYIREINRKLLLTRFAILYIYIYIYIYINRKLLLPRFAILPDVWTLVQATQRHFSHSCKLVPRPSFTLFYLFYLTYYYSYYYLLFIIIVVNFYLSFLCNTFYFLFLLLFNCLFLLFFCFFLFFFVFFRFFFIFTLQVISIFLCGALGTGSLLRHLINLNCTKTVSSVPLTSENYPLFF